MLIYVLYGVFILSCIVLVLFVLLQPGKADAGALFSSSVNSTAFGARGTQTLLSKITIGAAISFMVVAFLLSAPLITGQRSVITGAGEPPVPVPTAAPAPAQPPPGPAQQPAAAPVTAPSPAATAAPAASPAKSGKPQKGK